MNLKKIKDLELKVNQLVEIVPKDKNGYKSAGYYQFTDYLPGTRTPFIYITRDNSHKKNISLDMANTICLRDIKGIIQHD